MNIEHEVNKHDIDFAMVKLSNLLLYNILVFVLCILAKLQVMRMSIEQGNFQNYFHY